jgi:peptidoglycan/xylan/chitin deacetylase (PgdA/CDA1 family)
MSFNKVSIKKNFGKIFKYPYLKLRNKHKITIFVFHEISDNPSDYIKQNNLNLTINQFEKIIKLIEKSFNLISPKNMESLTNIDNSAVITFDDGYSGVFNNALPYLEKKKIPSLHFLNMYPIIEKKPNIVSTIQYLEKYNAQFQEFIFTENIKKPTYLEVSPKIFKKYNNQFGQLSEVELNKIIDFQGPLVNLKQLEDWDKSKYVYYGNHLFDHWNTITLDNINLEEQYSENFKYLNRYKNFINFFAFTNGQPDTCFNINNFNVIKKIGAELVFAASAGQNNTLNKILVDRLPINSMDIDENLFFYKILRSFFNFKIKKYQK